MSDFIKHYSPWLMLGLVWLASIILWLTSLAGDVNSMYQFFPILGILAWTTMWTQYLVGSIGWPLKNKAFTKWSEAIVLFLIVMHPTIFLVQRFIDTGLLPPASYLTYVGSTRAWTITIAVAALATFLLYDVLKRFNGKLIKRRLWAYVSLLQAAAMTAIFIHGFTIGTSMNSPYFATWWILLGLLLVPFMTIQLMHDFKSSSE